MTIIFAILLFSFLTSIPLLLYFSCSFPQTTLYIIITDIIKVHDLSFKHSVLQQPLLILFLQVHFPAFSFTQL